MSNFQDLNLKRQIFSKDSLRGELIVKKSDAFYLTGTTSGNALRSTEFIEYLNDEYIFYLNNSRTCRRGKLLEKGKLTSNLDMVDLQNSVSLTQTVGSDTHIPSVITSALSIGKMYFLSSISGNLMDFNYDFLTHTFTFVGLISIDSSISDYSFIDNGNTLAVYLSSATAPSIIKYYPLSIPYNISSKGTPTSVSSAIMIATRPYFFNNGKNAYYYQFVLGSGQFDFCVASMSTPYKIETALKRYGVGFNRTLLFSDFRPIAYPFTLNEERSIISIPMNSNNGSSMSHGNFTINGKFNKNLNVTIVV